MIKRGENCAFLFLSNECNLSCTHCYVRAQHPNSNHMPLSIVTKTIEFLKSLGIDDVRLTGGEPTIHPYINEVVELLTSNNFKIGIATNGIKLLDEKFSQRLLPILERCWISIYGTNEDDYAHVTRTNNNLFTKMINCIGRMTSEGFPVGISVSLSPTHNDDIDLFLKKCVDTGIRRVRFLPLQPDGRAPKNNENEWKNFESKIIDIVQKITSNNHRKYFEILSINDPFDLLNQYSNKPLTSCLLNKRAMWSVAPDGNIYSCCFNIYESTHAMIKLTQKNEFPSLKRPICQKSFHCRGANKSFWGSCKPKAVSCPISSVSLI